MVLYRTAKANVYTSIDKDCNGISSCFFPNSWENQPGIGGFSTVSYTLPTENEITRAAPALSITTSEHISMKLKILLKLRGPERAIARRTRHRI